MQQLGAVDRALDDLGDEASQAASQSAAALGKIAQAANGGLGTMLRFNEAMEMAGRIREAGAAAAEMADQWNGLQARLRLVTDSTEAYAQALSDVRAIADATGAEITATGDLYTTLARALKSLGDETTDVAALTTTISQAMELSGAGAQASEGAIRQLAQALSSGVLRGDEFNSVMEQAPRLQQALADALGVTTGQLRAMAAEGALSAETVIGALASQGERIGAEFASLPDTIGRASTRLRNAVLAMVGDMDDVTGASEGVAAAIGLVAEHLDSLATVAGGAAVGGLAASLLRAADAMRGYAAKSREAAQARRDLGIAERAAQAEQRDALALQARRAAGFATQAQAAQRAALAELDAARKSETAAKTQLAIMKELGLYGERRALTERELKTAIDARAAAEQNATVTATVAQGAQIAAGDLAKKATRASEEATLTTGRWAAAGRELGGAIKQLRDPFTAMTAATVALMGYELGGWLREVGLESLRTAEAGSLAARAYDLLATAAEKATAQQRENLDELAKVRKRISEQTGLDIRDQKQLNEAIERGALVMDEASGRWQRGAVALEDLAKGFSKTDAAFAVQAKALQDLAAREAEEQRVAQARAAVAVDVAGAAGDEGRALAALAAARDQDLAAAERALELARGEVASREERIANLRREAEANRQALNERLAKAEAEQRAAQMELEGQRLINAEAERSAETSAAVQESHERMLAAALQRVKASEQTAEGIRKEIAGHAEYTGAMRAVLAATNEELGAKERAQRQAEVALEAALAAADGARREAAAYSELVVVRAREVREAEAALRLTAQESGLRIQHTRNLITEARARGDLATAQSLLLRLGREEAAAAGAVATAARARASAAEAHVVALREQADAINDSSEATLAGIAAAAAAAESLGLEAAAAEEAARAARALANARRGMGESAGEAAAGSEQLNASVSAGGDLLKWMKQEIDTAIDALGRYSEAAAQTARAIMDGWGSFEEKTQAIRNLDAAALVANDSLAGMRQELDALEQGAAEAAAVIEQLNDFARTPVQLAWKGFYEGLRDIAEFEKRLAEAAATQKRLEIGSEQLGRALSDLGAEYQSGGLALDDYISRLEGLREQFGHLGAERLQGLRDALADAKRQMDDFAESARDGLLALKEEWASLNGQLAEAEQLRAMERRQEIERQILEAERAGNAEAVASLQQQLGLLDQITRKKLEAARAEEAERRSAEAERASASQGTAAPAQAARASSTRTVRVELRVGGRSTPIDVLEGQEDDLLEAIRRAGLAA